MKSAITSDFADKIRKLVEKCGGNQSEAARILGVSSVYVHEIAAGKKSVRYPRPPLLAALHRALGLPFQNATFLETGVRLVRVYGMAQALGCRVHHGDIVPDSDYDLPTVPMLDDGRRYAAFRVEGDSMLPTLKDGWTVICDCAMECRNGDLVVAKHDGVALIKRFRRIGDTCLFMSDNPAAGKDYEVHASAVVWCLRVVKFMGEM